MADQQNCQCVACKATPHKSDCAVHNEPAEPNGPCDCGAEAPLAQLQIERDEHQHWFRVAKLNADRADATEARLNGLCSAVEEIRLALAANAAPMDLGYALTQTEEVSLSTDLLRSLLDAYRESRQ